MSKNNRVSLWQFIVVLVLYAILLGGSWILQAWPVVIVLGALGILAVIVFAAIFGFAWILGRANTE